MSETKPTASVSRRDEGLALADALLESNRRLLPLPAAAHERVKRRLRARLHSPAPRRARWLRPVVVAGSLLLWGTAFGIAIDHFVLEHRLPAIPSMQPAAAPSNQHPRRPKEKARPTEEVVFEPEPGAPSAQTVPPDVLAPIIAPAVPAGLCRVVPHLRGTARRPAWTRFDRLDDLWQHRRSSSGQPGAKHRSSHGPVDVRHRPATTPGT